MDLETNFEQDGWIDNKAYKHDEAECRVVVSGTRDLIKQIANIDDPELRKHVCESALEMCDRLLQDGQRLK